VPQEVLDDLRRRLAATRWPDAGPGRGWDYGADLGYLRGLCEYWSDGYDWRAQEERLNAHPQFLCEVDGLDLHFWHARGGAGSFPLLLVHGWPGSMFEYRDLIEPLTRAGFDVIVPSLPGFGFGGKPHEPGWGVRRASAALHELMTGELGYARYGVHGGDWGSIVGSWLGAAYAGPVAAIHITVASAASPPPPAERTADDERALEERTRFRMVDGTHSFVQAARPDALTVGQEDSPAGLAAWIVQRFRNWSGPHALEETFSRDTLLTNLMFYWAPASAASSARFYYESRGDRESEHPFVAAPTAMAIFPDEPFRFPRAWVESAYNVVRWAELPRGGHFAALEVPDLVCDDVTSFFDTVA
jgi:microsomal epoxide hydrolase